MRGGEDVILVLLPPPPLIRVVGGEGGTERGVVQGKVNKGRKGEGWGGRCG